MSSHSAGERTSTSPALETAHLNRREIQDAQSREFPGNTVNGHLRGQVIAAPVCKASPLSPAAGTRCLIILEISPTSMPWGYNQGTGRPVLLLEEGTPFSASRAFLGSRPLLHLGSGHSGLCPPSHLFSPAPALLVLPLSGNDLGDWG